MACSSRFRRCAWLPSIAVLGTLFTLTPARGDEAGRVAAETLFQEGRRLVAEKRYEEACPKLAESHRIDPGIGTLLYLADCHELAGHHASAWAAFREAEGLAKRAGQEDRATSAAKRAAALEPKLVRVTLRLRTAPPGLTVKHNGLALSTALLGVPLPVDKGSHTFELAAPGKKARVVRVTVELSSIEQDVPELEDEAAPAVASSAPPPPRAIPPASRAPNVEPSAAPAPAKESRALTYAAFGVGGVGLIVGTVFGLSAKNAWDKSRNNCREGRFCNDEGLSQIDQAKSRATLSTVGFAVGIVGVGVGATLLLTRKESQTALTVAPGQVAVGGRF